MSKRLTTFIIVIISVCFIGVLFLNANVHAQYYDPNFYRSAKWHQTQTWTTPFGGTGIFGQFGPDIGMGEQGTYYQYTDPTAGSFVSYYSTGMGMGLGGPLLGYQGMYSQAAQGSYGPYAFGQRPQVQPTPGWTTQGYYSGDIFGQQTQYYEAQPNPMAQLMMGLLGGFGGFSGLGGLGGMLGLGGWGGLFAGYGGGYSGYGAGYGYPYGGGGSYPTMIF